jgi:plastocyanin
VPENRQQIILQQLQRTQHQTLQGICEYKYTNTCPVSQNPLTYTINIQNNAFNPSSVQIAVGGTVKWVNVDSVKHEPKGRVFDSGPIGQNGTFEYTFKSAGTYNYQCAIHPSMLGTIKVV